VTATPGFVSLGSLYDLWDADLTAWTFPGRKTEQRLLGNGTDTGNVVVQEGSKALRERTLVFTAQSTADMLTARGYEEASSSIDFTDYDSSVCSVQIMTFEATDQGADLWKVTVRLLQLTEPAVPGP